MTVKESSKMFSMLIMFSCLLLASCAVKSAGNEGWRPLSTDELRESWRDKSKERFSVVSADFNGDNVLDEARLLKRSDGSASGLFVFLSQKDGTLKTYELYSDSDRGMMQSLGIKKAAAGTYKTLCGKGYRDCQKGELPEVNLRHDAIDLFKNESASSLFYWDRKAKKFERVWISD